MRVVLDANVWVSAAIRTGPAHRIVQSWLAGSAVFDVVVCPALIAEVEEVLTRRPRMRKWIALEVAERYIETLRVVADIVSDPAEVEVATRDVDDDYLVALAREHGADSIVTGDKDLLEWFEQRPPVVTPGPLVHRPDRRRSGSHRERTGRARRRGDRRSLGHRPGGGATPRCRALGL